jgi:hypothetical protein
LLVVDSVDLVLGICDQDWFVGSVLPQRPFADSETVDREEVVQSGFESSADCFFWDVMSSGEHAGGDASERGFFVGECSENEVGVVAGRFRALDSSEQSADARLVSKQKFCRCEARAVTRADGEELVFRGGTCLHKLRLHRLTVTAKILITCAGASWDC